MVERLLTLADEAVGSKQKCSKIPSFWKDISHRHMKTFLSKELNVGVWERTIDSSKRTLLI